MYHYKHSTYTCQYQVHTSTYVVHASTYWYEPHILGLGILPGAYHIDCYVAGTLEVLFGHGPVKLITVLTNSDFLNLYILSTYMHKPGSDWFRIWFTHSLNLVQPSPYLVMV
jgi:hypothetical protein